MEYLKFHGRKVRIETDSINHEYDHSIYYF